MKFLENVKNGTRNRWLNFDSDSDHQLDPGIFKGFLLLHSQTILEPVVLVLNNNIDIKPYFCLSHRSILKYRVIDVFWERPSKLFRGF